MKKIRDLKPSQPGGFITFFKWLKRRISGVFEPEEVEVIFKMEGNHMRYTYTKVEHKQVA